MKSKFTITLVVFAVLAGSTLALDEDALLKDLSGLKTGRQNFYNVFQSKFNAYFDIIDLLCADPAENGNYDSQTIANVEAVKGTQIATYNRAYDVLRAILARIGMNVAATRPMAAVYTQLQNELKVFHDLIDKLIEGPGSLSIEEIDQAKENAVSQIIEIWKAIFQLMMESLAPNNERVNSAIANLLPGSTTTAVIAITAAYTGLKLYVIKISGQIQTGKVDISSAINIQRKLAVAAINDEVNTKLTLLDYIAAALATDTNQILIDFEAIHNAKLVTINGFQQALQALYPVLVGLGENNDISASLDALYRTFLEGERVAFFGTLQAVSYMQPNGSARVVIDIPRRNNELDEFATALVNALRSAQRNTRKFEKQAEIRRYQTSAKASLLSFYKALYDSIERTAGEVNDDMVPLFEDAWEKARVEIANVVDAIFDVITIFGTQNSSKTQNNSAVNLITLENAYGIISSNLTNEAWRKFVLILITRLSGFLQDNGMTDFLPLLLPVTKRTTSCS